MQFLLISARLILPGRGFGLTSKSGTATPWIKRHIDKKSAWMIMQTLKPYFRLVTTKPTGKMKYLDSGNPRGFSSWVVYQILKREFGKVVKPDDKEIEWEYVLQGSGPLISVHDNLGGLSIGTLCKGKGSSKGRDTNAARDVKILLDVLSNLAQDLEVPVSKARNQILDNLFIQNYLAGEYFLHYYYNNDEGERKQVQRVSRRFYPKELNILWVSLVSFVLSLEALFNTFYELNLRREISNNKSLFERIMKFSPEDKWIMSSILCNGFAYPLGKDYKGFSRLRRLTRLRNNLVHANITDKTRTYIVMEDGIQFWTTKEAVTTVEPVSLHDITVEMVREVKEDVDWIKQAVFSAMTPAGRKKLESSLSADHIITPSRSSI